MTSLPRVLAYWVKFFHNPCIYSSASKHEPSHRLFGVFINILVICYYSGVSIACLVIINWHRIFSAASLMRRNWLFWLPSNNCALQWCHMSISNHQQINCLLDILYRITTKKMSTPSSFAHPYHLHRWQMDSLYKRSVFRKTYPGHNVTMAWKRVSWCCYTIPCKCEKIKELEILLQTLILKNKLHWSEMKSRI